MGSERRRFMAHMQAAATAADKVFIIIAGNPSGNSPGRDLLPLNQGFN